MNRPGSDGRRGVRPVRHPAKIGARIAVVVGPDEWNARCVTVRDLHARSQETVAHGELVTHAGSTLARAVERHEPA